MAKRKENKIEIPATSLDMIDVIVNAMQDKKAEDIVIIDMKNMQNTLFDKFVVCSANSKPQSDTLIDHVAFSVKKQMGILPKHVEGTENASWAILDYFDIIVHVFDHESRGYFQLEKLWADAEVRSVETV